MLYFKYNKGVMEVDSNNAYFMTDYPALMGQLYIQNMFSTEVNTINYLKELYKDIAPTKTFVDVGAHVGTYTITLGKLFKECYAFEADTHTYNILCANIALHNMSQKCHTFNKPVADSIKDIIYTRLDECGGNNYCYNEGEEPELKCLYEHVNAPVPPEFIKKQAIPIDSLNINNIGLMKIDVEGFELEVLKGCSKTISDNNNPPILVESWNVNENNTNKQNTFISKLQKDLFDYLNQLGYNTFDNMENNNELYLVRKT